MKERAMQQNQINTEEAPNKWWAAQDARMRNIANKSHFPQVIQLQVERMKLVLDIVYTGVIYEAYGKKGVSILIDTPVVCDRVCLSELEAEWADKGWTKKVSPQGVIYRLTRP
jgi:hypothetical protein